MFRHRENPLLGTQKLDCNLANFVREQKLLSFQFTESIKKQLAVLVTLGILEGMIPERQLAGAGLVVGMVLGIERKTAVILIPFIHDLTDVLDGCLHVFVAGF